MLRGSPLLTAAVLLAALAHANAQQDGASGVPSTSRPDMPSISPSAAPAQNLQAPVLPAPTGPFGIGRTSYEWVDPERPDTRADMHAAKPGAHRDLMVYLWYPTTRNEKAGTGTYLPGAKEMAADPEVQRRVGDEFGDTWKPIVSGALVSHAVENASIAPSPRRLPVVLFSHGIGSTGFAYTSLIEDLVSHGYIVASIEHTYTAIGVVFPDGRVVSPRQETYPPDLTPAERFQRMQASAGAAITEGARDQVFVLHKLVEMNGQTKQTFPLAGRLDTDRVATMGHSAGGAFAALACQMDARFKACVSLDGALPPVAAFPEYGKGFTQPVLLLEVDHAGQRRGFDDAQEAVYQKKKEAQLNALPRGSYDVVLKSPGLFHASFSVEPLFFNNGKAAETAAALHNLELTQSFIRAFLDRNLSGGDGQLLTHPAKTPEATIVPYGR